MRGRVRCRFMQRTIAFLAIVILAGAGCASAPPSADSRIEFRVASSTAMAGYSPLCISFRDRQGFENWLNAYASGDQNGINLAINIHFPEQAEPLFLDQLRDSLPEGTTPTFLCSLDDRATIRTWMVERDEPVDGACTAENMLRILTETRAADIRTDGRDWDCKQFCKPKYQNRDTLVWQCDVRATEAGVTWTELHMSRMNGDTKTYGCKQDAEGVTAGCVR